MSDKPLSIDAALHRAQEALCVASTSHMPERIVAHTTVAEAYIRIAELQARRDQVSIATVLLQRAASKAHDLARGFLAVALRRRERTGKQR